MKLIYVVLESKSGDEDIGSTYTGKDARDIANQIKRDAYSFVDQTLYPKNKEELILAKEIETFIPDINISTDIGY